MLINDENQIIEFDEFETKLQEFKNQYDDVVYDLTVPEQEKKARSDKYTIGKIVSALDSKHKELKAPLKARTDLIDGRRKEIKDKLLEVQGKIKSQINAHEKVIEEHAEKLQSMVDAILAHVDLDSTGSGIIKDRLESINHIVIDDTYEDRKADATLAQVETIKELETMLSDRIKYEKEQAELENLRKEKEERERAEREEQIRKDAEEKAKHDAEAKIEEANRQKEKAEQAVIRAEEEKELAIEQAAKEERERIEHEQKLKDEQEEAERKKIETNKAKTAHRKKVQNQSIDSICLYLNIDKQDALDLVKAIDEGIIQNITINY